MKTYTIKFRTNDNTKYSHTIIGTKEDAEKMGAWMSRNIQKKTYAKVIKVVIEASEE